MSASRAGLRRGVGAALLALWLGPGCSLSDPFGARAGARTQALEAALVDLEREGFGFTADVRVRRDPVAVCSGLRCADVAVVSGRRTIGVAPEAFASEARLRLTLLEVWERHAAPRGGSTRNLARGLLRVLRDGPRVGVDDRDLLREAHRGYRRFWAELGVAGRGDLPSPDSIPYP